MNRQQMLSIIGTMSDDNLMRALSATGVECCDEMGMDGDYGSGLGAEDDGGELVSWNNTDVKVPKTKRPPLFDKNQTLDIPKPQVQYLSPDMGGGEMDPTMAGLAANA